MSTHLSRFCQHFDTTLRPLLAPLAEAGKAVAASGDDGPGAELQVPLAEVRHQLEALVDKVRAQQAYVLIFGPLKSGKSTLMNALASAYVSEVSSLPAYPCLVFVHDAEPRRYTVTDYAGGSQDFRDTESLRQRIASAHGELADSIRAAEEAGESFDPQEHFPQAIRRVDVRLPAPALRSSGAVLVDTPGLYTRMRFGYDRMTRDFRNAAACAVFVVKSDNLFLEQVFQEFDQLLDLFSRIFLVVNIDATKRDVGPDGSLVPSLEQKAPQRILAAFEDLAMSAPLRRARQEGRVCIYPVDLLHAASKSLSGDKLPEDFRRFRDELHAYLASPDYLAAFLGDSLRRAHGLVSALQDLCTGPQVADLQRQGAELAERRADLRHELDAIATCVGSDWGPVFARFARNLEEEIERRARDQGVRTSHAMAAAIDTWFLSGHSLAWLLDKQWIATIRDYREDVTRTALRVFEQHIGQGAAGIDLDPATAAFLDSQGIDLIAIRRQALAELGDPHWPAHTEVPVDPQEIPIRRGILDLVSLRSRDSVRDRLFGPADSLDRKIPTRMKASRLGGPAKQYLRQCLMEFRDELVQTTVQTLLAHFRDELNRSTKAAIERRLRQREPELRRALEQVERQSARLQAVAAPLQALGSAASEMAAKVHALATQHARTDVKELLAAPAEPEVVLEPRGRRGRDRRRDRSRQS